MKYIVDMPDKWDGQRCGTCCDCPLLYWVRKATKNKKTECPLATAKRAINVKFDIEDGGFSVIDEKGVFHFEGQDKYYAVEDK